MIGRSWFSFRMRFATFLHPFFRQIGRSFQLNCNNVGFDRMARSGNQKLVEDYGIAIIRHMWPSHHHDDSRHFLKKEKGPLSKVPAGPGTFLWRHALHYDDDRKRRRRGDNAIRCPDFREGFLDSWTQSSFIHLFICIIVWSSWTRHVSGSELLFVIRDSHFDESFPYYAPLETSNLCSVSFTVGIVSYWMLNIMWFYLRRRFVRTAVDVGGGIVSFARQSIKITGQREQRLYEEFSTSMTTRGIIIRQEQKNHHLIVIIVDVYRGKSQFHISI